MYRMVSKGYEMYQMGQQYKMLVMIMKCIEWLWNVANEYEMSTTV